MEENQRLEYMWRLDVRQCDFEPSRVEHAERALRALQHTAHIRILEVRVASTGMASLRSALERREGAKLQVTELHLECLDASEAVRLCLDARHILLNVTGVTKLTVIDITSEDLTVIEDMPTLNYLTIYYFRLADRFGSDAFPAAAASPAVRARLQRLVLGRYCPTHVLLGLLERHQETLEMLVCSANGLQEMQAVSRCLLLQQVAVGPGPHLHLLSALPRLWRLTLDLNGLECSVAPREALREAGPHLAGLLSLTELYVKCFGGCAVHNVCGELRAEMAPPNCTVNLCSKYFPGLYD